MSAQLSRRSIIEDYEATGLALGITVQEWEEARGLPPFTVYPHARFVRTEKEVGYHMYSHRRLTSSTGAQFHMRTDEEESRQIKCLVALGVKYRDIGALFSISAATVWRVTQR